MNGRARAPEVTPEAGWTPIEPPRLEMGRGSFVSGDPEGETLRVLYFRRPEDSRLVGRAWFGPGAEGPPGHAHGGSMAAVLDEAMGAAAWSAGYIVVAVQLDTSFRRMLPLGTDAFLEAWIEKVEERKVWTRGRLLDEDGSLFAEATALFVTLDPERFGPLLERVEKVLGRPLPRRP
jgi:acyl-coenzyme A thioesterase PaaI-like protein